MATSGERIWQRHFLGSELLGSEGCFDLREPRGRVRRTKRWEFDIDSSGGDYGWANHSIVPRLIFIHSSVAFVDWGHQCRVSSLS